MKKNSLHPPGRRAELPLLEQLTIDQSTLQPKALLVLDLLRRTASQYQTDHLHLFYSIRAVAARFGLSPATVSRVYERLSSERLLRLIWGSQTLLEPLEATQRCKPRSVAVPVDVCRFSSSAEYREAILNTQRELWTHRVAERLIFFQHSADEVMHLCKRHHVHGVDTVIWISPETVDRPVLLKLSALGMRVICIAANPIPGARECYRVPPGWRIGKMVRDKILNTSRRQAMTNAADSARFHCWTRARPSGFFRDV